MTVIRRPHRCDIDGDEYDPMGTIAACPCGHFWVKTFEYQDRWRRLTAPEVWIRRVFRRIPRKEGA